MSRARVTRRFRRAAKRIPSSAILFGLGALLFLRAYYLIAVALPGGSP